MKTVMKNHSFFMPIKYKLTSMRVGKSVLMHVDRDIDMSWVAVGFYCPLEANRQDETGQTLACFSYQSID